MSDPKPQDQTKSLRDYFAAAALSAFLPANARDYPAAAKCAYEAADAMMRERERQKPKATP